MSRLCPAGPGGSWALRLTLGDSAGACTSFRRFGTYRGVMDVGLLLRLKGVIEASAAQPTGRPGQAHAEAWPRVRAQVAEAVGDEALLREMDALFPATLASSGRPWGVQGDEAIVLMNQLGGWIGGLIEEALLEQRIRAEAEERAKRTGFA
jgi:hypothetical protein